MYKRSNTVLGSNLLSLSNYIEGNDVYNSLALVKLANPELPRELYEITVYEYRPDLIAKDFYGSEEYLDVLMIQTAMSLSDYTKGTVLSLLPKDTIDIILGIA